MKNNKYNRGISILGILLLGGVLILVISYYHISIRGVVESPEGQDNINYVKDTSTGFWDTYLEEPASYLWNDIWLDIFWRPFIENMKKIRDSSTSSLDNVGPQGYDESHADQ